MIQTVYPERKGDRGGGVGESRVLLCHLDFEPEWSVGAPCLDPNPLGGENQDRLFSKIGSSSKNEES